MRTLLSQFCEEFDAIVRALIQPAHATSEALDAASDALSCKQLRPAIVDLALQFESLADKVAEQQAYVLIFGPLKSGKSTLMNAIAGTYVSEVSSLPAYPCMVYVQHSADKEFTVTRYSGQTKTYEDPAELHMAIHRAHGELAERLRSDGALDPAADFPAAIRRIDFKLPAGELAQSSTVLVDTPGLYSRMKFGYDRMTRDFKSSAACAIFVVKPDNLFLEQVFAEFNELLELFSRIFLVVNIDSQKTDLAPDGSLKPSLEAENPLRIIEAFEDLAMSAPLKQAADEGRLRIYPIDLLHAAAGRIAGPQEPSAASEANAQSAARFESFRTDLTDYLDSTEYLVAFLGDSLRRSKTLLDELRGLGSRREVELLREADSALALDLKRTTERKTALSALTQVDWQAEFDGLREGLRERFEDARERIEERTRGVLDGAVDAWFQNGDSLETFNTKVIAGALRGHQEELLVFMEKELRDEVSKGDAGLTLRGTLESNLRMAEFDLTAVGSAALGELQLLDALLEPDAAVESGQIPVKKRFWDWVLFRSTTRVQRSFFGPHQRPSNRISKADKDKRLGRPGREAMLRAVDAATAEFFDAAAAHLEHDLFETYALRATDLCGAALAKKLEGVQRRHTDLERQQAEHRAILDNLDDLLSRASTATLAVETLWEEYGDTDPAQLKAPLSPPVDGVELDLTSDAEEPLPAEHQAEVAEALPEVELVPSSPLESEAPHGEVASDEEASPESSASVAEAGSGEDEEIRLDL